MPLSHGTHLGRYKIVSTLGTGGMGEVYCAEDALLSRQVAIKVLPEYLAESPEALKRFQKEAKALAALSHSNVLAIYDFVADRGLSFLVMELLDGETLRVRISNLPLTWQKSVDIAIGIAEGLAAAHSKGVVHRDLKPENVLLPSHGGVKILDFGLARLKSNLDTKELTDLETISRGTESGIVMGTLPYMSPEQVRGEHVDERSDIFSFGCVLYEMLSTKRPFRGNTPAELAASILRDDPQKITAIPPELNRIVQHCLEKDPQRRLHSAHDLTLALKDVLGSTSAKKALPALSLVRLKTKTILAVIIVAAVLVAALALKYYAVEQAAHPKIESLAVLPLKNLSGDPNQDYFSDSFTEELIAKLARISALRLISRTSVMEYKGSHHKSLSQISKELNVDAIIEGSVLQSGNRIRITAQLVHGATDKHLWTESYERNMTDILALQNEIASEVAQEIRVKLAPKEHEDFSKAPKVNPASYEAYLRGIDYTNRPEPTERELTLGITMLERAIEIDPKFVKSYPMLSMAHSRMHFEPYDSSAERLAQAKQAVDRAFELSPDLPEAHLALGYYYYWCLGNFDKALDEFYKAQKTIPNHRNVLAGIAAINKRRGNFQEALRLNRKALELDPRNAAAALELGIVYSVSGQYSDAQRYFDLAISIAPDAPGAYAWKVDNHIEWTGDTKVTRAIIMSIPDQDMRQDYVMWMEMLDRNYQAALNMLPLRTTSSSWSSILSGHCYRLMNKVNESHASYEAARIELEELLKKGSTRAELHSRISIAYAGLNRGEDAIREAKAAIEILPLSKDAINGPGMIRNLAIVYILLGQYEDAINQIEYLISNGVVVSVPMLRRDPMWQPLQNYPRFQKILEREAHKKTATM